MSYEEVRQAVGKWDAWLRDNGILREECLALWTRTDARSGAVLLALLACGQSVLLWRQPLATDDGRLRAEALPPFCRVALIDTVPDGGVSADPEGYQIVRAEQATSARGRPASPYVYLATSGTTGSPKIVAYEPDALLGNARNCVTRLGLTSADRVVIPVALAHMYGLGAGFLPAALAGASVRLIPDANLLSYVRAEADVDPTVAFLTPTFCHLLVKGRKRARRYRLTVLAGDAADAATFDAYEERYGCTLHLYGSTELGAVSAGGPVDTLVERRDTSGLPMPGVRVAPPEIPTDAADAPFPIRIDHPYGCAGYADEDGAPVKPASLFQDGWYRTMDLGRVTESGRLQLVGRFDDTVKRDGVLVAFADVERALQRLDMIERAVIVLGGVTPRGRELVAVYTTSAEAPTEAARLRRAAHQHLPGHAVPDRFLLVDALPMTATSKPDRQALATLVNGRGES